MTSPATIARMHLEELTGWRAGLTLAGRAPQGPELLAFQNRCAALRVPPASVDAAAQKWIGENTR